MRHVHRLHGVGRFIVVVAKPSPERIQVTRIRSLRVHARALLDPKRFEVAGGGLVESHRAAAPPEASASERSASMSARSFGIAAVRFS